MNIRTLVGVILIATEVCALIAFRRGKTRYFCWAPYDEFTEFEVKARLGRRLLDSAELYRTVGLPLRGRENRCAEHVFDRIRAFAAQAPRGSEMQAQVRFCVNGGPIRVWTWPEDQVREEIA